MYGLLEWIRKNNKQNIWKIKGKKTAYDTSRSSPGKWYENLHKRKISHKIQQISRNVCETDCVRDSDLSLRILHTIVLNEMKSSWVVTCLRSCVILSK